MEIFLLILSIALFCLIVWQKRYNDKAIKRIKEEHSKSKDDLDGKITKLSEAISNDISQIKTSLDSTNYNIVQANQKFTDSFRRSDEFANKIVNDINTKFDTVDDRIRMLSEALQNLAADNQSLRRDLENYTKIGEDSKRLNETEDIEGQDRLIDEILSKLSDENDKAKKTIDADNVNGFDGRNNNNSSEDIRSNVVGNLDEMSTSMLDNEQNAAYDIMMQSTENVFITGKAGTGKSFLLRLFVKANKDKKVILLAPTGISAINISGVTLHSAFGYANLVNASLEELEAGMIKLNSNKRKVLSKVDTIIIDEVSMVRADVFEKIDRILKSLGDADKVFGGKRLILFGDLFQLPPIAKGDEFRFLQERFGGIYFFNSDAYKQGNFKFIELSVNHRQKSDAPFFEILNRIREGKVSKNDLETLNSRTDYNQDDLRRVIRLFPKKEDAEKVNQEELEKIHDPERSYKAIVTYSVEDMSTALKENTFPITDILRLKVGALIMMVANDPEKRWANGTLGIVSELGKDSIKVEINGVEYNVSKCEFEEQEAIYKDGRIIYRTILKVEQFPIVLAYAITIHKSQGMTYKQIACDITRCFSPGQAYVALSRCSSLNGLYLLKKVDKNILNVDSCVKDFYLAHISN